MTRKYQKMIMPHLINQKEHEIKGQLFKWKWKMESISEKLI